MKKKNFFEPVYRDEFELFKKEGPMKTSLEKENKTKPIAQHESHTQYKKEA